MDGTLVQTRFSNTRAHNHHKKYRNKLNYIMEMSKRNHYQSQLSSNSQDPRKAWKQINSLIKGKEKSLTSTGELINPVNRQPTNDPTHTTNIFNDNFVFIGNKMAAAIISPANKQYPISCHGPQKSFVLHEATSEEVKIIIDNLLVSKCKNE